MKISDRTLGYLTLIALITLIAVIAFEMTEAHQESTSTIQVDFDELGSLQPEDPVVVRGYKIGAIGKVEWLGDRARVVIKFDEPIVLREGSQFINVNYALMGQRRIEIIPSKEGAKMGEDHIFTGVFEPGIAEVLRYIDDVNQQLAVVREMVHLITEGDSSHPSAQAIFENVMATMEGTLENADKLISSMQPALNHLFSQINGASEELISVTHQADTAIKVATDAVNEKMSQAENSLRTISEGASRANQIISDIENDTILNNLLTQRGTIDELTQLVNKVHELLAAIDPKNITVLDENGKPVKLVTWKSINLIGDNARDKAIKRAEKGESLPE